MKNKSIIAAGSLAALLSSATAEAADYRAYIVIDTGSQGGIVDREIAVSTKQMCLEVGKGAAPAYQLKHFGEYAPRNVTLTCIDDKAGTAESFICKKFKCEPRPQ